MKETKATLEAGGLMRDNALKPLDIARLSIIQLAKMLPARVEQQPLGVNEDGLWSPSPQDIAGGILDSLSTIVSDENLAEKKQTDLLTLRQELDDQPDVGKIDPFGTEYNCAVCRCELPNAYFHCDGCETYSSKDYNICCNCYNAGRYKINQQPDWDPSIKNPCTDQCHIAKDRQGKRTSQCKCKDGFWKVGGCIYEGCKTGFLKKNGQQDSLCRRCSCICHTRFTRRRRFYSVGYLNSIKEKCAQLAGDP